MKQINSIDFYFRISEQAKMAQDEDGNPCECYLKLGFTLKNPISEDELEFEKSKSENDALEIASAFSKKDSSYLSLISEQEYMDNTEED